jgi:hypothetical protein
MLRVGGSGKWNENHDTSGVDLHGYGVSNEPRSYSAIREPEFYA